MLFFTKIIAVLFLNLYGSLVIGQRWEGWLTSAKTEIIKNDFIDEFNVELTQTNSNTFVSMSINVTQPLPSDLMVVWGFFHDPWRFIYRGLKPLCYYLSHPVIGLYLRSVILPKNRFPETCPMIAGNWSVVKWEPLWDLISLTHRKGPFRGLAWIFPPNKTFWARIEFKGVLTMTIP